jgi:tetratricopeptide (TPR) repeat protein
MSQVGVESQATPYAEEAQVLIELKRYQEALTACSRAIASDPEEPANYATLTRIHLQLKQNQDALEAAKMVITLAPEWPYGYYLMSICRHNLLDFDGELNAAEHALSLDPEDPILLDRLARAQIQSGLLKRAKLTATQLTRISPEDVDTYSLLSDICFELDDYANAETHLLSALQLTPEDHVLHNDMGRIHLARKAWLAAVDAFYKAVKLQPAAKIYQDNLKMAITNWLDSQTIRGNRSQALEMLAPEIRAFYRHKLDSRTAFERLGIFGPILASIALLAILVILFNSLL